MLKASVLRTDIKQTPKIRHICKNVFSAIMQYKHLFFDLDHTLWDFEANSRLTLEELYHSLGLQARGVHDLDLFHKRYSVHNEKLWDRYRNGYIKVDELRWK